jgi:hypothetical protein
MTNQHPITPPPELVKQWVGDGYLSDVHHNEEDWAYEQHIATHAAQWGADQELDACCQWFAFHYSVFIARNLRAVRRPKPPSLKEQALAILEKEPEDAKELIVFDTDQVKIIRRALEQLDD